MAVALIRTSGWGLAPTVVAGEELVLIVTARAGPPSVPCPLPLPWAIGPTLQGVHGRRPPAVTKARGFGTPFADSRGAATMSIPAGVA